MGKQNQVSNTPMVLGIIGGVLGLPAAICSGACAAGLSTLAEGATEKASQDAGNVFMWLGLIAALLGLVSAFLYKKNPKGWGAMMLLGGIIAGITLVTFNFLSLTVCVLLLIGGLIAITQNSPITE